VNGGGQGREGGRGAECVHVRLISIILQGLTFKDCHNYQLLSVSKCLFAEKR
jgi:hypothetical protein